MDWQTAANIGTTLTPLIALGAAFYAAYQVNELKRQRRMDALLRAIAFIQEERVRKAREIVYSLRESKKDYKSWTTEERNETDLALRRYNRLAMMVEDNLISPEPMLSEFGDSIVDCWVAAKPLVQEFRETRKPDYWQKLENLYKLARARGYSGRRVSEIGSGSAVSTR